MSKSQPKKKKAKKPSKYQEKIAFPELEGKSFEESVAMFMRFERPKPKVKEGAVKKPKK